jgi:hypothetical protein
MKKKNESVVERASMTARADECLKKCIDRWELDTCQTIVWL